jgi:hypothetical protein
VRTIETTATITAEGRLLADVPPDVEPGTHRVVLVIEDQTAGRDAGDEARGLLEAATTSLAFWDNPYDDEDWNDA